MHTLKRPTMVWTTGWDMLPKLAVILLTMFFSSALAVAQGGGGEVGRESGTAAERGGDEGRADEAGPRRGLGIEVVPHDTMPGWRVERVVEGLKAQRVGLRPGDVILAATDGEGKPLPISPDDGGDAIRGVLTSDHYKLTVMREGQDPPVFMVTVDFGDGPRADGGERANPLAGGAARRVERANPLATGAARRGGESNADRGERGNPLAAGAARGGGGSNAERGGRSNPLAAGATAQSADGYDRIVLIKATIRDTNTDPEVKGLVSHTLLAPKGWKVEGGAIWAGDIFAPNPTPTVQVTADDGTQAGLLSVFTFADLRPTQAGMRFDARFLQGVPQEVSGMPVKRTPDKPEAWKQFLTEFLSSDSSVKDLRVDGPTEIPEMTRLLQKEIEPMQKGLQQQIAMSRQLGMDMQAGANAQALSFDITFTKDGKQYESAALMTPIVVWRQNEMGFESQWTPGPVLLLTAPKGKLEARLPVLMAIIDSVRPTQEWRRGVAQVSARIAKIKADSDRKIDGMRREGAEATRKTYSEINRINRETSEYLRNNQQESYENRIAASDDNSRRVTNALTSRADYSVDGNVDNAVSLPNDYDRVYTNGSGEYILLDQGTDYDPSLDPTLSGQDWKIMKSHDD